MSEPAPKAMTVDEYLRSEARSPVKREYIGGFVYPLHAQAGASKRHTLIGTNILYALYPAAQERGCRLYGNDMRLAVEGGAAFFYPDVMVCCGPDDGNTHSESDPCLLVDILSDSTASHDRFGKYGIYTALPGLQTYLIAEQRTRRVYAYSRQGKDWRLDDLEGSGSVFLPCLGTEITLDEMYRSVL